MVQEHLGDDSQMVTDQDLYVKYFYPASDKHIYFASFSKAKAVGIPHGNDITRHQNRNSKNALFALVARSEGKRSQSSLAEVIGSFAMPTRPSTAGTKCCCGPSPFVAKAYTSYAIPTINNFLDWCNLSQSAYRRALSNYVFK